jgi:ribosome-interacting GTPase 1
MPANLTPEYRAADAKHRAARTPEAKRLALEEMLATIPKHKGTEKMQADLKRRLARLRQEEQSKTARRGHSVRVEPEGAAQIVLLGPPNCGKSALLAALTRAEPAVADYPFTTTRPQPGMMPYEDVQLQLVDLPPITAEHMDHWLGDLVRGADGALLIADAASAALLDDVDVVRARLAAVHITLVRELPENPETKDTPIRTFLVVTKTDVARPADLAALRELYGAIYPMVEVAIPSRTGLEDLKSAIWRWLQLVRVYAKPPGKPVDRKAPFILHLGSTVHDLAEDIHRELAERIQFARIWGGELQGLRAARDFVLRDGDIVELHF